MTDTQIKKLDREFQIRCIELSQGLSVLGGTAEVIHHFIHRRNMSTRWYIPNGIPLTHEQHMRLENQDRQLMERLIERRLGPAWQKQLIIQANKVAKNIDPNIVREHLQGLRRNYDS